MPLHVLSAREVQVAGSGDHADGGGLFLRVKQSNANWLLRYTSPSGRRRDMGLGVAHRDTMPAAGESLRLAREKAKRARDDLAAGRDPIDAKRAARRADAEKSAGAKAERKAEALTLARVARAYHERAIEPGMNAKYSEVWIRSLECHVPPAIWNKPVAEVGAVELFEALAKVKRVLPETANRVRRRLAAVFDDAIFFGHCAVNPAGAIRRKMGEVASGKQSTNLRALPYDQVPDFVAELRKQQGIAARCLEFALLTASRTAEVLGATWEEIDERTGAWTIPGARMKGGDDHTVYLSPRAPAILAQMRAIGSAYLFPSPMNPQKPLSSMGMLTLLDRMQYRDRTTVHGLCRASFSTWANDNGIARPDVIEACLAHREADKVRAAYNRAAFHAERAALLRAWADFCDGRESATKTTRRRKSAAVVRFPEQGATRTAGTRMPQAADPSSGELLGNHR
jgi:integrase